MPAIKAFASGSASRSREIVQGFSAVSAPLASSLNAAPSGGRHLTPKELSAALARAGISIGQRAIQARANLPASHPLHIARNPAFPGRVYIPAAELVRLLDSREACA